MKFLRENIIDIFAGQGLFVLDDASNRGFLSVTKDKFAQLMYNKTISDLTDYEKERKIGWRLTKLSKILKENKMLIVHMIFMLNYQNFQKKF